MDQAKNHKRIFLIGWDNTRQAFIRAALELQNRGYEISYCVIRDKNELAKNKLQFKRTQFHSHDDAINLIPPPEIDEAEFSPPGEDLIRNLYEIESILATMKKFYKKSSSMLAKKHLFHRLIRYWHGVIKKFNPEIIFFSGYPHTVFDYTIYSLAKFLKIKTILFANTGIAGRYLLISDFKESCVALREEYLKNKDKQFKVEDLSEDMRQFYKWHLDYTVGEVQPELKQALKNFTGANKLLLKSKVLIKSFYDLSFFKKIAGYVAKEIGSNLKKEYEALQAAPDYDKKYVYLPLSYQPECSSSPLGGVFVDQILMIKILSYCLPKDWLIYVKEHPMQWAIGNLAYFDFRYKGYYEEIAKIKNVKIVPIGTNSHKLIVNSKAVGTVSGTAGMEALWRLKPVLLFGNITYQDCPGVFKVKNSEACREAIEKILLGFKISQQEIINFLVSLDRASQLLSFEKSEKNFSKISEEVMSNNLVNAITAEAEKVI